MNILITGGTGLVGKSLVKKLTEIGHIVRILTRNPSQNSNELKWNISEKYIDEKAFNDLNCIIHLAGATISERWTESYKKEMYSSRVDAAELIQDYCVKLGIRLDSFISASGINYYGTFTSDQILKENSPIVQHDFLANLCEKWEKSAYLFSSIADRVVCLRTSMVLAKSGGAFPLLKKIVDFNVGSAIGSGDQWMNWIHVDDLVNMYVFAVENSRVSGGFNAVSDDLVTNESFMKKLAASSNKLFLPINVPRFVMKSVLGEMSTIILEGTRADNKKIKSLGFDLKYSNLNNAFKSLI
ncbi:TIGR01777 family protein [Chryseobacterium sp. SNU WT5]|uniref:TIGR01777 family oxidoreductase n=1 Tax=Chryseobacterium sp. SNU WT5 TaxID=2594269 RepID=UPI00117E1DFD|nr:TIGR01777 family oxidoreductase [Chryseobacterium sp. SNU WT5]QDP84256.1 TIGR01777 family protein [Chryseobacterium sp. SNU WT5]